MSGRWAMARSMVLFPVLVVVAGGLGMVMGVAIMLMVFGGLAWKAVQRHDCRRAA